MKQAAKTLLKRALQPFGIRSKADLLRPIRAGQHALALARERLQTRFAARAWARGEARPTDRPVVLFVSHAEQRCGVHEFGRMIAATLRASRVFEFVYVECANAGALLRAVVQHRPAAIIYNRHPQTLAWMNPRVAEIVRHATGQAVRQIAIIHDCPQAVVDAALADHADYYIAPDPTLQRRNPIVYPSGRLIPRYENHFPLPGIVTVGTFGFGLRHKRFDLVVQAVQREFSRAIVRINIPSNDIVDGDGKLAREVGAWVESLPKKDGVELRITHDFLDDAGLLDFLAQNTVNAFFYDRLEGAGLSAAVDVALAVGRPLAVNRSTMFRHVWAARPSICIEDTPLKDIIAHGVAPLAPFIKAWSPEQLVRSYEQAVQGALAGASWIEAGQAAPSSSAADRSPFGASTMRRHT